MIIMSFEKCKGGKSCICYSKEKEEYICKHGPHFNKKLLDFAVSHMYRKNESGLKELIEPYSNDYITALLDTHGVQLERNSLYDALYVACMCKADFLGSSIADDYHLALYIKDVIDDVDAVEGTVFNRWCSDISYSGICVDWEEMI